MEAAGYSFLRFSFPQPLKVKAIFQILAVMTYMKTPGEVLKYSLRRACKNNPKEYPSMALKWFDDIVDNSDLDVSLNLIRCRIMQLDNCFGVSLDSFSFKKFSLEKLDKQV